MEKAQTKFWITPSTLTLKPCILYNYDICSNFFQFHPIVVPCERYGLAFIRIFEKWVSFGIWASERREFSCTRWFEMLTLNSARFSQWNLPIYFFSQPYHWRGLWNIPSYRCCRIRYCITWVVEISRTDVHDRWLADVFQRRESCATSSRSPRKQRRTLIVTVSH